MFGVKGNWNVRGTCIKEEDTEGLLFVRGLRSGVDFLRKLIGYFIEETYSHECLHLEILGLRDSYNVLLVETFDREVLTICVKIIEENFQSSRKHILTNVRVLKFSRPSIEKC